MGRFSGQIDIVAVGRLRSAYWLEAQEQYLKRLKHYSSVRLVEVKDSVGKGVSDDVAMSKEGELLISASENARLRVLLTAEGAALSSEAFAEWLQRNLEKHGHIAFVIGGPTGFSETVRSAVSESVSLSSMTYPHEIARILLLEQVYRAFTILNNEHYHK